MRSCLPALVVALRFRHCGGPVRRGSGKRYQRATAEAGVKYGGMVLIIGAGEVLFVYCLLFGDGKALFVLVLRINPPPGSYASSRSTRLGVFLNYLLLLECPPRHSSSWFVWLFVGSVDGAAPLLFEVGRHRRAATFPLATTKAVSIINH